MLTDIVMNTHRYSNGHFSEKNVKGVSWNTHNDIFQSREKLGNESNKHTVNLINHYIILIRGTTPWYKYLKIITIGIKIML